MVGAAGAAPLQLVRPDADHSPEDGRPSHLLVMEAVSKSFGTTKAVQQVDFAVHATEIVGLMGGNGAGKSTLMKIVGGLIAADSGEIQLLGRRLGTDHSPRAAMQLGLRFVHQELSLCPNLRVFENFAIELPDVIRGVRWQARGCEFARAALDEVFPGNSIDPHAKVETLSLSQQQMVEIARATSHPATKLLIFDEPTSSLGARQAEQLRAYMRQRRGEGISFIFISHRLRETLEVADRITVMRNGRVAWTGATSGIGDVGLMELLGGRHVDATLPRAPTPAVGREALVRVRDLREGGLRGVSLEVGRGEIVGLAGLEGSGQRRVLRSVFAGTHRGAGDVTVDGKVAFVSGNRAVEGIFALWSVDENIAVSSLRRLTRHGLLSLRRVREFAAAWIERLKIYVASGSANITALSGGNQQKVVIARALAADASVIVLDDPTRGVDMATKADLYRLFRSLADAGRAVLWYSTDDAEFAECDRTLVLRDGAVVAEFPRGQTSEERLVEASFRKLDVGGASRAPLVAARARRRDALIWAMIPPVTFAIVFTLCAAQNPLILSAFGLTLVFSAAFALSFAAISQLFVITAGDIDLGVGNYIGLVNALAATWLVTDPWLALLCFAGMLAAYPLMGLFIDACRVPAIIVTLGLSFVWLGLAAYRLPRAGGSAPDWLVDLLRIKTPLIPLPVLLCVVPALVAWLVLIVWRYGAVLRGFGASPRAIEAAGWSTRWAKATLYGLAGTFAFLAGMVVTASTRGGDPTGATSMTLLSVAAVILGGAAFSGGAVAPIGALFGTLTLVMVGTLLSLFEVSAVYLPMVQGLMLLGAIGIRTLLTWRTAP
jgi:ribose transport system ATP-binding protein